MNAEGGSGGLLFGWQFGIDHILFWCDDRVSLATATHSPQAGGRGLQKKEEKDNDARKRSIESGSHTRHKNETDVQKSQQHRKAALPMLRMQSPKRIAFEMRSLRKGEPANPMGSTD